MRLYIASKHQDKALRLARLLEADGHTITSRWITDDKKFAAGNHSDSERQELALMDEEDVRSANALILISDPLKLNLSGGKHVEFGIALALRYPIYVVGHRENIFHHHPSVRVFRTHKALTNALRTKLRRRKSTRGRSTPARPKGK